MEAVTSRTGAPGLELLSPSICCHNYSPRTAAAAHKGALLEQTAWPGGRDGDFSGSTGPQRVKCGCLGSPPSPHIPTANRAGIPSAAGPRPVGLAGGSPRGWGGGRSN